MSAQLIVVGMYFQRAAIQYNYGPEELTEIISQTQAVMGKDCLVELEFVNTIPHISSGKYRYTISEVQSEQYLPNEFTSMFLLQ